MKDKRGKRKKGIAIWLAMILACSNAVGLKAQVPSASNSNEIRFQQTEVQKTEEKPGEIMQNDTPDDPVREVLSSDLDPENHLKLWVLEEVLEETELEEETEEESGEDSSEGAGEETGEESGKATEAETGKEPEEKTQGESEEIEAESGEESENESGEEAFEENPIETEESDLIEQEKSQESDPADLQEDNQEDSEEDRPKENSINSGEEQEETKTDSDDSSISGGPESPDEDDQEVENKEEERPILSSSMATPVSERRTPIRTMAASAHDPEEDQKLVLTRVFSYWKKDLWISPLFRDQANVSTGGMTSTVLSLHRLGNISDGYPYLTNYIWAYCIEPDVGSNSWTVYQNTSRNAVQLMLKIEKDAPSVYHGMIRAIAYTEYQAKQLSSGNAAALRCACQTVVWQLICGMVDGSTGERYLKDGSGQIADLLYDNIAAGALSLYDNYRETNIASFTGENVREKLEEIYAYLGEYEKIPSFMSNSKEESQTQVITMNYANGQYRAEVEDETGVLSSFLETRGTIPNSSIHFVRDGNKVVFTAESVPEEALKISKKTQPESKTPAYFVYGSYSGEERKQSLLGACNPDQVNAWIRFAPARKQTGVIKVSDQTLCPEGILNNPNYDLNGAVFGIFDEENTLREKITLTTDVTAYFDSGTELTEIQKALAEELKKSGSTGDKKNTLAVGISEQTYDVGEKLTIKELVVPRGYRKASNQKLTVSENETKNIWHVTESPILDPLELQFYKKGETELKIPSTWLNNAEFTLRFYPEEAGTGAQKPTGDPLWTGVFITANGGKLQLYREYCIEGLEDFVGTINPLTGDLIFPFGWIEIQETKAPEGFQLNPASIWIRLGEDRTETEIPDQELIRETETGVDFINQQGTWGTIRGKKTDGEMPLAGAEFMICNENGQPLSFNGRKDSDFNPVVLSGEDGIFSWEGLAFGTYLIKEIKAPEGYEIDPQAQDGIRVEITADQVEDDLLLIELDEIVNQPKTVQIAIYKKLERGDFCSYESISWNQIRFQIRGVTEKGETLEQVVSMENADIVDPAAKKRTEETDFGSEEDAQNGDSLSLEERVLIVRDLPRGTYTITEILEESVDSYEIPQPQTVDFLAVSTYVPEMEVTFENHLRRYDLRILKRSADTGENLEGSVFRLEVKDYQMEWEKQQENGTEWMEDEKGQYQWRLIEELECTDAAAGVTFRNLAKGEYRLYETRSPYPYQLLIQNVTLTLPFPGDYGDEPITVVLQDRAILHPVSSGGAGRTSIFFLLSGLLLIGGSILLGRRKGKQICQRN